MMLNVGSGLVWPWAITAFEGESEIVNISICKILVSDDIG